MNWEPLVIAGLILLGCLLVALSASMVTVRGKVEPIDWQELDLTVPTQASRKTPKMRIK
jgi:hypothetical protein